MVPEGPGTALHFLVWTRSLQRPTAALADRMPAGVEGVVTPTYAVYISAVAAFFQVANGGAILWVLETFRRRRRLDQ